MVTRIRIYHHSRDIRYRTPGGALPCASTVTLRLRVEGAKPEEVLLRQWFGKESFTPMQPSQEDAGLYEAHIRLPSTPCLLWYDFQLWVDGQFYWYGNAMDGLGGAGALIWGSARSYQITVYDPAFEAPAWTDGAVFYQIFPDRFARGHRHATPHLTEGRYYHEEWDEVPLRMIDPETGDNVAHDFFGGTLNGIREKLPYLVSLGVTALYLNPIFFAHTNHRFDTSDWKLVDPLLGTDEAFVTLCREAQVHGIRIILDGVFSHAGDHNPMFQHARRMENSPYRNWFRFEHWPDMYKSWWGFTTLPELDKRQPEVVRYFLTGKDAVVKHWLLKGASGWRIDVADELPMPYLKALRQAAHEAKKDALVIGEVWEDASNKVSYGELRSYCLGDTLDGVMNYPLREAAIGFLLGDLDAGMFARRMASLYENYPPAFARSLLNILGSHDRARILNVLAGADGADLSPEERAVFRLSSAERNLGMKRLKLLLQLIVAMPGMPCVYYGDEAGMEGCADPFNRGTFPWDHEDRALTDYFAQALQRRRNIPALTDGALWIEAPYPNLLYVKRTSPDGSIAVTVINRSGRRMTAVVEDLPIQVDGYGWLTWETSLSPEGQLEAP